MNTKSKWEELKEENRLKKIEVVEEELVTIKKVSLILKIIKNIKKLFKK